MPAIPSFINNYKSGWKAKAVIKSSLSRFNRTDTSSSIPTLDVPPSLDSPAVPSVIDITDDQSSLDFDGGQPDEFEDDILDKSSEPHSSRPSNVSSASPPAKLEISLPPELRIDWFADKFSGVPPNATKAKADTNPKVAANAGVNHLDQHTRDTLAGKIKDDQGLVETLEDVLARHVDSNPSRLVSISGLHLELPEMSPTNNLPLTDPLDVAFRKHPRDSLTMLTSRLSLADTPASSALSGTTLARALISNTFAMPIDQFSINFGEVGLTRSDSTVLPRDSVHRNMFSIAPDAPPMPPDAETLYVAPKKPRADRRKQIKRRSSTGTLNTKTLPGLRSSLIFSTCPEFDTLLTSPRPWSLDTAPESSPSISIRESTTPVTPPSETAKSESNSFTLRPLPEVVRRLPDPRSPPPAGVSPSISTQSSTPSQELDTQGLEDVLDYYNRDSPGPLLTGAAFRPLVSPIKEETSSQLSPASSLWNDRRDSKILPPIGGRSPRNTRPSPTQVPLPFPSHLDLSPGVSENSGSLKSSRSFEPQLSDTVSGGQDVQSHARQRSQSIPLPTSPGVESSCLGEDLRRSNDHSLRNAADDSGSQSSGRVAHSDGSYISDAPMMNILPQIPTTPMQIMDFDQSAPRADVGMHAQLLESSPSQTGLAAVSTLSISSPNLVRSNSIDRLSPPTLISSTKSTVNSTAIEESDSHTAVSDPLIPRHLRAYKDDFLRDSTLSIGSPPPYYEVIQANYPGPSTLSPAHVGPSPVAGPSRLSGEWGMNESRRDSPARARIRPRPPLPIGPRRPSQGVIPLPSSAGFSITRTRSGSSASMSQPVLSRQRSVQLLSIPSPKFQTPPPKWRGHTMEAARWTFRSSQLQAIVSKAIKQSSEASLIRLLEPEILENDLPAEISRLETLRMDVKTRYKLLTRRRAVLFETLSTFLSGNSEEGSGYAHRQLEELSEISATLDQLAEELHSADAQLAHLYSLTQVHMSSALAVALRKLNTSFLKQMAENEDLRNELLSVEVERDEAWRQAERIAVELDQLAELSPNPSPVLSKRSSKVSAHRKSMALASKAGLKATRRFSKRLSLRVSPSTSAFGMSVGSPGPSLKGFQRPEKPISPARKKQVPNSTESTVLSPAVLGYSPSSALIHAQDELYTLLGLNIPQTGLKRSRSWIDSTTSSPQEIVSPSLRHSVFLSNNPPSSGRRSSLPPDSTLAQVSNAMAADRNAMLVTFDMISATDTDNPSRYSIPVSI